MDDLKAMLYDPDGHQLLAVVATVHHQGVDQPLDDGALSLAEALGGIPSTAVGKILGVLLLHGDVVLERKTFILHRMSRHYRFHESHKVHDSVKKVGDEFCHQDAHSVQRRGITSLKPPFKRKQR